MNFIGVRPLEPASPDGHLNDDNPSAPGANRGIGARLAATMADPTSFYTGWLVDPAERDTLLARFPPRYAQVIAHHVTLKFGDREAQPPGEVGAWIVGQADDGLGVQALVVAIDGGAARPDGGTFHITWSLADGREARESNHVIAAQGWAPFDAPVPVRLIPRR